MATKGIGGIAGWLLAVGMLATTSHRAQAEDGPETLVQAVATDVLETVKADPEMQNGNLPRIMELVDRRVMPHVDMARLTGLAMGRHWRTATPEQQIRLQAEFKMLLVRSYAGALSLVNARQTIELRPTRTPPGSSEVIVVTRIRGRGDPVAIDYRLYRTADGWRIYDVSFLGVWLAENYRNSFADEIAANGIDGLIEKLHARNTSKSST